MKITILKLAFFMLSGVVMAQNNSPVKNVGNITGITVSEQKISFNTANGYGEVIVYAPNIIRVRLDRNPLGRDFSYAVIAKSQTTKANISQTADAVTIQTDSLQARITKMPYSITFLTKDGKVISQDESGLSTSWIGDEVTTYKKMQPGERFIGLGEKTGNLDRAGSGYTNWNTDAFGYGAGQDPIYSTIPFYVGIHSGLNYGVFMDNTYQSDFNFGASNNRFSSLAHKGEK